MRQWTTVAWTLALLGSAAVAGAGAVGTEDDLAIVKKAVASPAPARARESRQAAATKAPLPRLGGPQVAAEAESRVEAVAQVAPAVPEARPLPRVGREPQWFKVRIVERATGRKKVTINLPLSLVRVLGDDTIDWGCRGDGDRRHCHTVRLSEVLRSLEAGQELVEIEDEDATVKVWVE